MKELLKQLRKLGFRKLFAVPLGFEEDVERAREGLRKYEIVEGGDKFPKLSDEYVVRYLGMRGGKHYWLVGKG